MPVGAQSPSFELTATGLGKETTFGSSTTPTMWLACSDITFTPKNVPLARQGARQRVSQSYPTTGRYTLTGTMTVESQPDVLGPILAVSMGAEAVTTSASSSGSPTAYDHTFSLASPLNSFTIQENRVNDAINYAGCMVTSLKFSVSPTAILSAALGMQASRDAINSSPNTPSFSTTEPFRFEDPLNTVKLNGTLANIDVKSFEITCATGLAAGEPIFGSGRFDTKFNQQQYKVSGTMTLKFNTEVAQKLFYGSSTATSPASTITPVALEFYFHGKDAINTGVNYGILFKMENCFPTEATVAGKAGGVMEQMFTFECGESAPGAADDLVVVLTNATATAF